LRKTSDGDVRIRIDHVTKTFLVRHQNSLKETAIALFRRRRLASPWAALDDVSFDIREGESVALIGFNGSGKSTLLKLISGVFRPNGGSIGLRGRVVGLIEVGGGFHGDLTGRQNVYLNAAILGMSRAETDERFDRIVEFAGVGEFLDTEVKHYSSGMFVRLAFSVAIHVEHDILLIDEVLAVGDEPFQKKCFDKLAELQSAGKTIVVVSHDFASIQRVCERGIVLDAHKVVYDGPVAAAIEKLRSIEGADRG
jgi:ABC-2 type transport system ATP-binding protein